MPPLRFFRELMPFYHVQAVGSSFHQPAEFFAHFRQLVRRGLGVQVFVADVLEFGLIILVHPILHFQLQGHCSQVFRCCHVSIPPLFTK